MRPQKITSIISVGKSLTYDLEVDSVDHNFLANGMVVSNSHSTSYAYLGWICAWIKKFYPLEWWTSVMQNSTPDDLKANAHLCSDFVVPPDINRSDMDFYIIDEGRSKIVYPLGMVRGVKKAGEDIVAHKPFSSLADFYNRVTRRVVHRGVMASLVWSGAFDELCGVTCPLDRNRVYREYLDLRGDIKPDKYPEQLNEFEVLLKQNEALPLNSADFSQLIRQQTGKRILSFEEVGELSEKQRCLVAGVITSVRVHTPKKVGGKTMCFVEIYDKSMKLDVTVFNDVYLARRHKLVEGTPVLIEGKFNSYKGKNGIIADNITAYGIVLPGEAGPDTEDGADEGAGAIAG